MTVALISSQESALRSRDSIVTGNSPLIRYLLRTVCHTNDGLRNAITILEKSRGEIP